MRIINGRNILVCIEKTETKNAERKNIESAINAASRDGTGNGKRPAGPGPVENF
jgi:hypothetical protein